MTAITADQIDALLPQTQCTQCGFDGCRPYAEAIADGTASIDRCPPGDDAGAARLARLLGVAPVPVDRQYGQPRSRHVAVIDERHCIGCTLCLRACPVDAIVGANKFMHTVLPELCSGCDLCIAPCPVDCIDMVPARAWDQADADAARVRHQARDRRRLADEPVAPPPEASAPQAAQVSDADARKRDVIAQALARARARRAG